jgi:peptide/nickel transport system permease protein
VVKFVFKKLFYGFLVLLGVIVVVFFLFNVLPGDPARMTLGQRADEASIKAIKKDLGLDQPLTTQFLMYLNDLSPISVHNDVDPDHHLYLDPDKYTATKLFHVSESKALVVKYPYLRRSYQSKRKVSEIIMDTLPETAVLAFASMLFAAVFGIILGIFSALKKNSWFDRGALVFATLGMSGPSFYFGAIFAWLFGYILADFTGLNVQGSLFTADDYGNGEYLTLENLILPAITLGLRPLSIIVQLTRSSLLDVMSQDYIRTARAKGLGFYTVVFKHALKNALNPVITSISGFFAGLMAGALFVEIVFSWKGIGYEIYYALERYDLPVVMGATLVFAIVFVIINILVDIVYGFLDPRVRLQ